MEKMLKDLKPVERAILIKQLRMVADKGGLVAEKSTATYYGTGMVSYGPDPDGTKLVFSWGEKKFFGSSRANVKPFDPDTAFIIDLTNQGWPAGATTPRTKVIQISGYKVAPEYQAELKKLLTWEWDEVIPDPVPHLKIEWQDMTALGANTDFWDYLIQGLPDGKIIINCQGGKGRTGTALAALWMSANKLSGTLISAKDAIALVRKNHCPQAVENKLQEDYLGRLETEWAREMKLEEKK
jgi:protein-tyrosine phosphatase